MNYSTYRFTLDIHKTRSQVTIPVMYQDTWVRLYVNLTDGGKPYQIAEGCTAVLYAKKADGTALVNDCEVIDNNTRIMYTFNEQTASALGPVECEIRLYSEGLHLTTPSFAILVEERVIEDDDIIESEGERSAIDRFFESETEREEAEAERKASEEERTEAEAYRREEEAKRQEAEEQREALFGGTGINSLNSINERIDFINKELANKSDKLGLSKGAVDNSIQQIGNEAGTKGYYWDYIDIENKKIYLTTELKLPSIGIENKLDESFSTPDYPIGGRLFLVNGNNYFSATISSVQNNVITYDGEIGFDKIADVVDRGIHDYTVFVIEAPTVGEVEVRHGSIAFGSGTKSLGSNSISEGKNTTAIGNFSHAEGLDTVAHNIAHAEGRGSIAEGAHSHAEGVGTKTLSSASHTEGSGSIAEGVCSHAEGKNTHTYGSASHAEGVGTEATRDGAHSEGMDTHATGVASHAEGEGTHATGKNSHAGGLNTNATNSQATALGSGTTASGQNSLAIGNGTSAENTNSFAGGASSKAKGLGSIALGYGAESNGMYAVALGNSTIASGNFSFAQGAPDGTTKTEASGGHSTALGQGTKASGQSSLAQGLGTIANGPKQSVFGQYNVADTSKVQIVGWGTKSAPRNIYTLDTNGNATFSGSVTSNGNKLINATEASEIATLAVAKVVDSAPEELNTLRELAVALKDTEDAAAAMVKEIAKKVDTTTMEEAIANKADKTGVDKALAAMNDAIDKKYDSDDLPTIAQAVIDATPDAATTAEILDKLGEHDEQITENTERLVYIDGITVPRANYAYEKIANIERGDLSVPKATFAANATTAKKVSTTPIVISYNPDANSQNVTLEANSIYHVMVNEANSYAWPVTCFTLQVDGGNTMVASSIGGASGNRGGSFTKLYQGRYAPKGNYSAGTFVFLSADLSNGGTFDNYDQAVTITFVKIAEYTS